MKITSNLQFICCHCSCPSCGWWVHCLYPAKRWIRSVGGSTFILSSPRSLFIMVCYAQPKVNLRPSFAIISEVRQWNWCCIWVFWFLYVLFNKADAMRFILRLWFFILCLQVLKCHLSGKIQIREISNIPHRILAPVWFDFSFYSLQAGSLIFQQNLEINWK